MALPISFRGKRETPSAGETGRLMARPRQLCTQRKGDQSIHHPATNLPPCHPATYVVPGVKPFRPGALGYLGLKGSRFSGPGRVFRILPDLSVAELP